MFFFAFFFCVYLCVQFLGAHVQLGCCWSGGHSVTAASEVGGRNLPGPEPLN